MSHSGIFKKPLEKKGNPSIKSSKSDTTERHTMSNYILSCHCQTKCCTETFKTFKTTSISPQISFTFAFGFWNPLKLPSGLVIFCGFRLWQFLVNQRASCYFKADACYYCRVATPVPESAQFKLCFRFSWLRFKLHLEVPDLNVAVVLMRGTMAFSEPVRWGGREPYNFELFMYQLRLCCCCARSSVRQSVKTDANRRCEVLA